MQDAFLKLLIRPYNLLLRDVLKVYQLLDSKIRIKIWIVAFFMLLQAGAELTMIKAIQQLGIATSNPQGIALEPPYRSLFANIPDFALWAETDPSRYLLIAAASVAVIVVIKNTITYITMHQTAKTSETISLSVATEIIQRYLYSPYLWHLSGKASQTLQIMLWRNDLASLLIQQLSAITGFLTCFVLFFCLIVQEPLLSLTTMTIMISTGVWLYASLRKKIDKAASATLQSSTEENKTILAVTRGVREVLLYGQQEAFRKTFMESLKGAFKAKVFLNQCHSLPSQILEALGFIMIPLAVIVLGQSGASMESILAAVMLLVLTAWRILPYLNRGVSQMMSIRSLRPQATAVLDYLRDLRQMPLKEIQYTPDPNFSFQKTIRLDEVSFQYPTAAKKNLKNISLTVPRGACVGFIGPSGAGKSTICNILCGLCPPTEGKFLIDEKEPTADELEAFKRKVGFVPQSPFLLEGSLAANVAFSHWGTPWDPQHIVEACKQAAINFIPLTPEGICYPVGEDGKGLSGGQAQRVCIARALYAKPEVIIFDEATSALDTGNENIIVSTIARLREHITVFIIAHRLSTVQHCDIIYWIDDGVIVDFGTPDAIIPKYMATFSSDEQKK